MTTSVDDDPNQAWVSLPRRIYLDTSVLQTVYDYGEVIWEGEGFKPTGRAARVRGLAEEVDALRVIFLVNERAGFRFVVTDASLREVQGRNRQGYTQWVLDVQETWLIQLWEAAEPTTAVRVYALFSSPRFGNISAKDRRLLQDAVDTRCDAFLTMEQKLPKNAEFIERETGLRVMRPSTYWSLLGRWARLYD
jgi:hypothetical protein